MNELLHHARKVLADAGVPGTVRTGIAEPGGMAVLLELASPNRAAAAKAAEVFRIARLQLEADSMASGDGVLDRMADGDTVRVVRMDEDDD